MSSMSYHQRPTVQTPVVDKVRRSEEYYLPSGDIIFFVENYLYRVHRYFFERESPYFRQRFSAPAPPGQAPKGSSDSNPFPLEETTSLDFNRFLWVFYNPKYNIYETGPEEWISILKLACTWGFDEVKRFAVRELETKFQEPLDKIRLYHRYQVDKLLLVPSYLAMALRPEPLTLAEGSDLGLETALTIARAREFARGIPARNGNPGGPAKVTLDVPQMESLIRSLFLPAPIDSSPTQMSGGGPGAHMPMVQPPTPQRDARHAQPQPQPAATLFQPIPAPARDLSDIWSSPTTPTVVDSGSVTPAAPVAQEPKLPTVPESPVAGRGDRTGTPKPAAINTGALAADINAAEQGKTEEDSEDSWFGMGGGKKKKGAPASGGATKPKVR